jgi:hypothetical protein
MFTNTIVSQFIAIIVIDIKYIFQGSRVPPPPNLLLFGYIIQEEIAKFGYWSEMKVI